MAMSHVITGAGEGPAHLAVRTVSFADLKAALAKGVDDFSAMPSHALFLCIIYPIAGLVLGRLAIGYDVLPLLFPLMAGFALVGPFAAIGLYEMSRRREQGLDISWRHVFDVRHRPTFAAIVTLGVLLMAIFLVWIAVAQAIYIATFGYLPAASIPDFFQRVLTTPEGWTLIVVGNAVGFLFAVLVLSISVVSFPLLIDRDVGAAGAIVTSWRVVLANPVTMAAWGFIVAVLLVLGSIPLLFGLAVVMPVLGHATWHLYRRAVEPNLGAPPELQPEPPGRRYAAEFPASLFARSRDDVA
ncbi:MAG: DUF2189 domain-containing protein [Hyphomicrobiales bacterium]|nr:DUF2189 domain-containing protein [Hyphomicrobiales bacterium]MBV8823903.1 DUF2189 domain-containing protein [Hyphomicrobiales bacterium]